MSKSEIEELPEELQRILLKYIDPLYKSISTLLHSPEDFDRRLKDVTSEYLNYTTLTLMALTEGEVALLINYLTTGEKRRPTASVSSQEEALTDAIDIIANFIWLTVEPSYRDYVSKYQDVFIPYRNLLVYTAVLGYIVNNPGEIESSIITKVTDKTKEITGTVEGYVDTIEIEADPEQRAILERIKQ